MKKLFALILVGLGIGWAVFIVAKSLPATPMPIAGDSVVSPLASLSPSPFPIGNPTTLRIPTLEIDTSIEEVGMEASGRMGVPTTAETVGWWKLGPKPGEKGSAVLAGHYDTPQGDAGVFYKLHTLTAGDEIFVSDSTGIERMFRVLRTEIYSDAAFPIPIVFGQSDGYYLNLITCSGTFDRVTKNYDQRYVIFAELIRK